MFVGLSGVLLLQDMSFKSEWCLLNLNVNFFKSLFICLLLLSVSLFLRNSLLKWVDFISTLKHTGFEY